MNNILIGTCGYSYADWVELNFSYYRQPDPRTLERMIYLTADDFMFAVKAHQSITHEISESFADDIKEFKQGIEPLIQASKLAAIVIQFPYSFHYTAESRKHLLAVCGAFAGLPAAVEFRSDEWLRDSVYKGLAEYNIAFVNVDEPALKGLPKPTDIVTSNIAYARFHGRNAREWWTGDNASRYDYLYSDDELAEWLGRIKKMVKQCSKVIIAFNNHWKGQAVTNAKRIKEMLEQSS
jgi:uncharacterized protein YecE (DUF72 family)